MPTATEARSVDPTRTSVLRKRYRQHYRRMWQRVNAAINEYIDGVDFSRPLAQRMVEFNRFVDALLQQEFGRTESDRERGVRAMATMAYMRGIAQANTEVEEDMPTPQQAVMQADHNDAIGALILLLSTGLMGVRLGLISQLLDRYQRANNAAEAKAAIRDRILKKGRTPTDTLAADGVVRAYNDALLNVYEGAGTQFVGAVEEKAFWQTMEDDGVCFPKNTMVETINGAMPIQDVSVGDLVKTRAGYRPVLTTMKRKYSGKMVIIRAGEKDIVSTANHPYWTLEKGWLDGINVQPGHTLQSVNNEMVKVRGVVDFNIGDPDNMPSSIVKVLGFLLVSLRILMPIDAINFERNMNRLQQKVYGVCSHLCLLGVLYTQRCKGDADFLFRNGFAHKLSIAGETTESFLLNLSRTYPKLFVAIAAIYRMWWTTAYLRAVFPIVALLRVPKFFFTPQAFVDSYYSMYPLAFDGAVVVPISVRSRTDDELITAPYAGFGDGVSPSFIKTLSRAISSLFRLLRMGKSSFFSADGTGEHLGVPVSTTFVRAPYGTVKSKIFSLVSLAANKFFSAMSAISVFPVRAIFQYGNPFSSNMTELYHLMSTKSIFVYNVEVANEHEYYANGILVHNCDYCHTMSQIEDKGFGPGIYTIAQARGLIPAHPRCRCRWRPLPIRTERSQGTMISAESPRYKLWRVPQEIGPPPHLRGYRGGGHKPVQDK